MSTWALSTTGCIGNINQGACCYGNGTYLIGTDQNEIATSPDGVTWTLQASPFTGVLAIPQIYAVTYGGGSSFFQPLAFVATASDAGGAGQMWSATSPDGVTWSAPSEFPVGDYALNQNLAFGDGQYVFVTDSGEPLVGATSPDGLTWTVSATLPNFFTGLVFVNGVFIGSINDGSGDYISTSPDGNTWTDSAPGFVASPTGIIGYNAAASGPLAGLYAASDGTITLLSASPSFTPNTSTATGFESTGYIQGFAFDGLNSGQLVCVGSPAAIYAQNPQAAVTSDGITWTYEDLAFGQPAGVFGVQYLGGQFVAYGGVGLFSIRGPNGPPSPTIPDVTNQSLPIATVNLNNAGFVVGTVTSAPSGVIISGNVISQNPVGGTVDPAGTAVNLLLSSGLPQLFVPDLFGLTETEATTLLLSLGLAVGAIATAPSKYVAPGDVQTQNPSAGAPVAAGTIVSFVLSSGTPPAVGNVFDFEATIISQYANSPTILQLAANLNEYIDQSANFANFYNYVWNVDTAVGFGLDIWGKIVNVSRLLEIPNTTDYVGFYMSSESQPDQDWQPMGSDQPPQPAVGGQMYTGYNATQTYLLDDNAYRQLILAKAFANICTTTAPAINQILQNLYGPGNAWVLNTGTMAISYNLSFTPTAIQLAILQQSGVIPTPPGVSFVINTDV